MTTHHTRALACLIGCAIIACHPNRKADQGPDTDQIEAPPSISAPSPLPCAESARFSGLHDALDPHLAPILTGEGGASRDWLVGWTQDDGQKGQVFVSTHNAARACKPSQALSRPEVDAFALRLATSPSGLMAVWGESASDKTRIMAAPLKADGSTLGTPKVLAEGSKGPERPGLPAVVADKGGFSVVWPEGKTIEALKLDPRGQILARASWPGGNLRPAGHINGPNTNKTRSNPMPSRPHLQTNKDALLVRWTAEIWISDDQLAHGWLSALVDWKRQTASEPEPHLRGMPTWHDWAAFSEPITSEVSLLFGHNPNGGPWELRPTGGTANKPDDPPMTREPAGPLEARLHATSQALLALWASPTAKGVLIQALDPASGAPSGPTRRIASASPQGELGFEVASGPRGAVMVAFVDRAEVPGKQKGTPVSRAVIRLVPVSEAVAIEPVAYTRPTMDYTQKPTPTFFTTASTVEGRTLLAWQDYWTSKINALWLDPGGDAVLSKRKTVGPNAPRYGGPSVMGIGESVAVALHRCSDSSMCDNPSLHMAILAPDKNAPARRITMGHWPTFPILALDKANTKGGPWRVALLAHQVMKDRAVVRVVEVDAPGKLPAALSKAPDKIVEAGARVLAAVWHRGSLIALLAPGSTKGPTRLVKIDGDVVTRALTIEDHPYNVWGHQRLISAPGGLAIIAQRRRRGLGSDVVLHWLADDAASIRATTVLGRGFGLNGPTLDQNSKGEVGAYWSDWASDGSYVAFVTPEGLRRDGPIRLDDPAIRTSRPHGIVASTASGWRAFWIDPNGLFQRQFK